MASKGLREDAPHPSKDAHGGAAKGASGPRPASGRIGTYALKYELGSGALSTVYLAQRVDARSVVQWCALKVLRPELARRADVVDGFLAQAHKAAPVHHPFLSQPIDIGTADGMPYVASEFLVAEPLVRIQAVLLGKHAEVSVPYVSELIACAAEGLHAAHVAVDVTGQPLNLVHRNVSPRNILALDDGTVRVVDFGCSPAAKIRGAATGDDASRGAYMSPEALKTRGIDARSDVWSLGVVLWEMLAGRPLFKKNSEVRVVVAVLEATIDPPSRFNNAVPSALDDVVMRALQRDRELRYASAAQFALELRNAYTRAFGALTTRAVADWINTLFSVSLGIRRALVGGKPPALRGEATAAVAEANLLALPTSVYVRKSANDSLPPLFTFGAISEVDFSPRTIVLDAFAPEAESASSAPPRDNMAGMLEPEGTETGARRVAKARGHKLWQLAAPVLGLVGLTAAGALAGWLWQRTTSPERPEVELQQAPSLAPLALAPPSTPPRARAADVAPVAAPQPPSIEPADPARAEVDPVRTAIATTALPPPTRTPSRAAKTGARVAVPATSSREASGNSELGEIYVATQSKSIFVSHAGAREVSAPGKLSLPAGTQTITIRHADTGRREERSVRVFAGALVMVSVN